MYKALAAKLAQKGAQYNVDQSLESMIRKRVTDPDTTTLLSWLQAMSTGGMVSCEKQKIFLQPACMGPSCSLTMSKEFQDRHGSLAAAIRTAAINSKGKWAFDKTGKSAQKAYKIFRKRDVLNFMLQERRVAYAPSALASAF